MVTFVVEPDLVDVPEWVTDLATFRRWMDSDDVPEKARICFRQVVPLDAGSRRIRGSRIHAGGPVTFVPTYSVAMPNVSGCHFTSSNPCWRNRWASSSPSGNSMTLAGR